MKLWQALAEHTRKLFHCLLMTSLQLHFTSVFQRFRRPDAAGVSSIAGSLLLLVYLLLPIFLLLLTILLLLAIHHLLMGAITVHITMVLTG